MTARWPPLAALTVGLGGALLIALLVLGRDTEVFPTYLVYTADHQPLPRPGLVPLPDGSERLLRFELIPRGDTTDDIERLDRALAQSHVAGLVLDSETYAAVPRDQLRDWRRAGVILVIYGVSPLQLVGELERAPRSAGGGTNQSSLVGPASTARLIGDPSRIDPTRPFMGVIYLPPPLADALTNDIGWMAWLDADDWNVPLLLVRWANESHLAYLQD